MFVFKRYRKWWDMATKSWGDDQRQRRSFFQAKNTHKSSTLMLVLDETFLIFLLWLKNDSYHTMKNWLMCLCVQKGNKAKSKKSQRSQTRPFHFVKKLYYYIHIYKLYTKNKPRDHHLYYFSQSRTKFLYSVVRRRTHKGNLNSRLLFRVDVCVCVFLEKSPRWQKFCDFIFWVCQCMCVLLFFHSTHILFVVLPGDYMRWFQP